MLTDLSGYLDDQKFNDLRNRLEHVDTNTALAGEGEMAVLWAISRVAHMQPEPILPGSANRPDAASADLFLSGPAVIEVRALSDDSFSGKEAMDRTANIITAYADRLRKEAGKHLYFEYNEQSGYRPVETRRGQISKFYRERSVDPNFKLTPEIREQLRVWINSPDWPNPPAVRIMHGKTDVVITWRTSTVRQFRTFCRMPAIAYDLEDNPIYKALKKKAEQVKGAADRTLRCVVLVDAGCGLLRRLRPMSPIHEVGGEAIIRHALSKLSIDIVIVLSPYREQSMINLVRSELIWNVSCFDRRGNMLDTEYDGIRRLAAQLPRPRLEGYQARAVHQQGGFAPGRRRWNLGAQITSGGNGQMTIKLSAGLLHEYLAGRIDNERFRQEVFGTEQQNVFTLEFMRGNSIRQARFESGGIDRDDDYIVFELDSDPTKVPGRIPPPSSDNNNN